MKISTILQERRVTVSFEVFPPKQQSGLDSVKGAVAELCRLHPDFMSVTYGASGGIGVHTCDIASFVGEQCGTTPLSHLTCLLSSREDIHRNLDELRAHGIENVLALRGDPPADGSINPYGEFHHAAELIREIKSYAPEFCIGGACYPEGHPDSAHLSEDLDHLKEKVDEGLDFITTQMFFDNNIFYRFLYKIRERGIRIPVLAGIMPVVNAGSIRRICRLSNTTLPERFRSIVDRFGDRPETMAQAGIAYATEQIIDLLANGVHSIHIYTMNKPEIAGGIMRNLSEILGDGRR